MKYFLKFLVGVISLLGLYPFIPKSGLTLSERVGYSFDYFVYNTQGYICYSIFNLSLYLSKYLLNQYREVIENVKSNPTTINDIVFALHGLLMCMILGVQIIRYDRGTQKVSWSTWFISGVLWLGVSVTALIVSLNLIPFIWFIQSLGYLKMGVSLVKYTPQAWLNFKRKSTLGWSIEAVLLDMAGGLLSFGQMFTTALGSDDWSSFKGGNIPKLGLSILTIGFDTLFIIQHYILYRQAHIALEDERTLSINQPLIEKENHV